MAKIKMVLFAGEKDGQEINFDSRHLPEVWYVVPYTDEPKIAAAKSVQVKSELREKLAVLAYRHDPDHPLNSAERYIMVRCPSKDRVSKA